MLAWDKTFTLFLTDEGEVEEALYDEKVERKRRCKCHFRADSDDSRRNKGLGGVILLCANTHSEPLNVAILRDSFIRLLP